MLTHKVNRETKSATIDLTYSELKHIGNALDMYIETLDKDSRDVRILNGFLCMLINILHEGTVYDTTIKYLDIAFGLEDDTDKRR